MSHLYFMNKVIILRNIYVIVKFFAPLQKENKCSDAPAVDLLYTVLEQEITIGANADTAKTKREKKIAFFERWI